LSTTRPSTRFLSMALATAKLEATRWPRLFQQATMPYDSVSQLLLPLTSLSSQPSSLITSSATYLFLNRLVASSSTSWAALLEDIKMELPFRLSLCESEVSNSNLFEETSVHYLCRTQTISHSFCAGYLSVEPHVLWRPQCDNQKKYDLQGFFLDYTTIFSDFLGTFLPVLFRAIWNISLFACWKKQEKNLFFKKKLSYPAVTSTACPCMCPHVSFKLVGTRCPTLHTR